MKRKTKKILAAAAAAMLLAQSAALADTISMNGTVVSKETCEIYAPIGGVVDKVCVEVGQEVSAGDVLATLKTTKIYAAESGTVTGLFGQPGDSADEISSRYGAVLYLEGESDYTLAASTSEAYDEVENKLVHVGEEVYLSCYSDGNHTGTGVITSVEGTDYTVEVRTGEFLVGEKVSVYRGDKAKSANRIGRGKLSRKSPAAVTGTGAIVSFAVADGDVVQRGDLLFETLDGSFDGLRMTGSQIIAETDGTICTLNLQQGSSIQKDAVVAALYPKNAMRIEAQVSESDLHEIAVGDPVSIELVWNQDDSILYDGAISRISRIASADTADVCYDVFIDFTPDENTRYGMSAVITTQESSLNP